MTESKYQIQNYLVYEAEHYKVHDCVSIPSDGCEVLRADSVLFKNKKAIASQSCCGANLKFVTLPENIEYIGQSAFSCNENLLKFEARDGLQIIGRYAFSDCYELRCVTLPKSLKLIGKHAFKRCYQLQEVTIPPQVKWLPSVEDSPFVSCPKLEKIECNSCLKDTIIEYSAFLPSLRKVVLTDEEGNKLSTLMCAERKVASDNLGSKKNFRIVQDLKMTEECQSKRDSELKL